VNLCQFDGSAVTLRQQRKNRVTRMSLAPYPTERYDTYP
jgi:hypothetical protein